MKTVTIRDFRTRPRQVREALRHEREAVLTVNGRPVAVLIPADASSIDDTLEMVRRARGLEALRAIRRESRSAGRGRLTTATSRTSSRKPGGRAAAVPADENRP